MAARSSDERRIGPVGTFLRAGSGIALLVAAPLNGAAWLDVVLGLVVYPTAIIVILMARGADAEPLRLTGLGGHALNATILILLYLVAPGAWMIFIGTSLLLAAGVGYAGCEILAIANCLRRRDDTIACPVLHPVDAVEHRMAHQLSERP